MANSYDPHEALVASARRHPEVYRLIVGILVVGFVAITLNTMLDRFLASIIADYEPQLWWEGKTPGSMLTVLFGFAFIILGTGAAARLLQDRNPLSLIGPLQPAATQFWQVCRYLIFLNIVMLVLPPYDGPVEAELVPNLPFSAWLLLLPLSLTALLIQVSAEELLFRGYVQQCLAARFQSLWIWLVLPSALFGLAHYIPAEAGGNALMIATWAAVFGLLMADLTARSGTLGPAIAVHFVNNLAALLIFSFPDSMNGLALYVIPVSMSDVDSLRPWLMVDFLLIVISWLAARVAIAR
jgi:membrane protease YdiL (CAAX protease family)